MGSTVEKVRMSKVVAMKMGSDGMKAGGVAVTKVVGDRPGPPEHWETTGGCTPG